MRPRISIRGYVRRSVGPLVRPSVRNAFVKSGEMKHLQREKYAELIWYVWCAFPHLYDRICPSIGLSIKISDSLFISLFSPRTHRWPLGLVSKSARITETHLICLRCIPASLWRICLSVGPFVKISGSLSSSISPFSPRTHRWPLGLVFSYANSYRNDNEDISNDKDENITNAYNNS